MTTSTPLWLYDEVSELGCGAAWFTRELATAGQGPVSLHINSCGGSLWEGLAIFNALKQHPGRVSVSIDGLAASIASIIAMAADPGMLFIAKNATIVIHSAWAVTAGDAAEHRKQANVLDSMTSLLADIYSERTGQPAELWLDLMREETYFTGGEAVTALLADAVLPVSVAA